jgi:alpha-amylase
LYIHEGLAKRCSELSNVSSSCYFYSATPLRDFSQAPLVGGMQSANRTLWDLFYEQPNVQANCSDSTLLGTFSENHDVSRFASFTDDIQLAKNVISYVIMSDGIPMIYNGQEQQYTGPSQDGGNREAIWLSKFDTSAPLYQHTKLMNKIRNWYVKMVADQVKMWSGYWKYKCKLVYADDHTLAIRKGVAGYRMMTVVSNMGDNSEDWGPIGIFDSDWVDGTLVVELTSCNTTITNGGALTTTIVNGNTQVWADPVTLNGTDFCPELLKNLSIARLGEKSANSSSPYLAGAPSTLTSPPMVMLASALTIATGLMFSL